MENFSHALPLMLVILDGFGFSEKIPGNAVAAASMPTWHQLTSMYPSTLLHASGEWVGLPADQPGNSEVGHLTIGAGKPLPGLLKQINTSIEDHSFFEKKILSDFFDHIQKQGLRLHLMGLLSSGGVHSHERHLYALLTAAWQYNIAPFMHLFADGRDVAPRSVSLSLEQLELFLIKHRHNQGVIASLQGRFYAMDRDRNWERTESAFTMLTSKPDNQNTLSWRNYLAACYHKKITDEFIPPQLLVPEGYIHHQDAVIFFNFRPDRARQLTQRFLEKTDTILLTMAPYFEDTPEHVPEDTPKDSRAENTFSHKKYFYLFDAVKAENTFLDELQKQTHNKYNIFTIAETEKYLHVTRFLHGAGKTTVPGELQQLIPSIKAKQYVTEPRMSAYKITQTVIERLRSSHDDIIIINYANADMVGHSGNFEATVQAVEFLDEQLRLLYHECVEKRNGTLLITADHGNSECMLYPNGSPHTAHTANKVPCIIAHRAFQGLKIQPSSSWSLAHIAPTILALLSLKIPETMLQKALIRFSNQVI